MDFLSNWIAGTAPMWAVVILLVVGFAFLVKGADYFVEGSSSVAKRFNVPSIIIGLTIVAMGTSLPETAVSVTASINDSNALAISNAVGSNIFNMMVVIGVCALLSVVPVQRQVIKADIPFSIICALLLLGAGMLGLFDAGSMTLGRVDGIVFLVLFACYIGFLIRQALKASKEGREVQVEGADEIEILPVWKSLLFIIGGGIAIALGGDVTVDTASRIAVSLGMSETLVGLTIVSIGTSLPELVTSVVAARKNEVEMALGNAIGSNVFNILMVLGIASAISPIEIGMHNIIDIIVLVVFSLVVWAMAASKKKIGKLEGFIMLVLYAAYVVYIIMR